MCDDWNCVKHRTQTISRMYKEGLLKDEDIYSDLPEIISGKNAGRTNDEEFIYFCSVGLAYLDIALSEYVYEECLKRNIGTKFDFN